jgi:hypothetical protein
MLAMLVPPTLSWCCHHPRHADDPTSLTMPLPLLSRLCCHSHHLAVATTLSFLLPSCNNCSLRSIFLILSVLFPHRAVATHHTILLQIIRLSLATICCRNPQLPVAMICSNSFKGPRPFFRGPIALPFYGQFLTLLLLMVMK